MKNHTLTGNVVVDGTLSAGISPGTLSFANNLTLNSGSTSLFELNSPGVVGGTGAGGNDLVNVAGTLNLSGTLDARVAAAGYYRLFNYGTQGGGGGFGTEIITSTQAGFTVASHQVQYSIPGQVNLSVMGTGQTMQFWDGADSTGNGVVNGGSGTWGGTGTNWTGAPGQANINGPWGGSVGIFAGTAGGTVAVQGTQSFDTLQFSSNGYVLNGGTLAFNPASGSFATMQVDNNISTTVGSTLADGGTGTRLLKTGGGRLTLTGINTYSGGTTISGGDLWLTGAGTLGTGLVTVNAGRLDLRGTSNFTNNLTINPGGRATIRSTVTLGSQTITLAPGGSFFGPAPYTAGLQVYGNLGGATVNNAGYLQFLNTATGPSTSVAPVAVGATVVNSSDGIVDLSDRGSITTKAVGIGSLSGGGRIQLGVTQLALGALNKDDAISGVIADSFANIGFGGFGGSLVKTGTGMLTLSGANSYTGGTTISAGTLQLGNGGTSGSITGDVINNGVFAFNRADPVTFGGAISGTGSVSQIGAGSLTLTGTNSYSGGTTLAGGTLSVVGDANLGAASGGLTFSGGALANTASFDSARAISLYAAGRFDVAGGTTLGLTGAVSGGGDLIKQGAGALTLSGANAYGNTLVQAGTLVGNAASINGTISNAGSVIFDQATNASFAGAITGLVSTDGVMVKRGAGVLTLAGTSALDWTVEAGGLVSAADRFAGNVAIATGAGFAFDQASDGPYAGVLSGSGSFAKAGAGSVRLTGDSSGFAGATTVSGGSLIVGQNGSGALGGSLTIASGGLLAGTGALGSIGSTVTVAAGAVHAPGNSIGTQTIAGNYVNHGTLHIEGTPSGTDKIVVAGVVDISGATLDLLLSPATAASWNVHNGPFTLIGKQSAGAVTGTFGTITNNLIFLDPSLDYAGGDGNDVTLQLNRNDLTFAGVGLTRNQVATGAAVDALPIDNAVWNAIASSTSETVVRNSFDQLSGEIYASAKSALIEESRFIRNATNERIRAAFEGVAASSTPVLGYGAEGARLAPAATDRFVAWGAAFGTWGRFDGDGNAAAMEGRTGGFLMGVDDLAFDTWRLGLLAGYSHSSFDVKERRASGASDNYHAGLYAGTQLGSFGIRSGLAYTWHDISTNRSIAIPGFADSLKGDYRAGTFQAFGEVGYRFDTAVASFEPFANLAYVSLRTDDFSERGGAAALTGTGQTTDATFTTLGLRASSDFIFGGVDMTAKGTLGWRHTFGDTIPLSMQAFAGGNGFSIAGTPIARDSAVIEAGLNLNLTPTATLGLSYQGQIASGAQDHGFRANLAVKF